MAWLAELLMSEGHAARGRTRGRAGARQDSDAGGPDGARAVSDGCVSGPAAAPVVGEALLAIGRFTTRDDLAPILRWTTAADVEVRWRAAWALFRPRDPAAVSRLFELSLTRLPRCGSGRCAVWPRRSSPRPASISRRPSARAARRRPQSRSPRPGRGSARARAVRRRRVVRGRARGAGVAGYVALGVGGRIDTRFKARADVVVPRLVAATVPARPTSLRMTALAPLAALAPERGRRRRGGARALVEPSRRDCRPSAAEAGRARAGAARRARCGFGDEGIRSRRRGAPGARPAAPKRSDDDYRRIVERWIVPDYNGAAKPRAVLTTPRGEIELELYAGDAPLGLDYFVPSSSNPARSSAPSSAAWCRTSSPSSVRSGTP